jgi:SpoIID/LytB domain protein
MAMADHDPGRTPDPHERMPTRLDQVREAMRHDGRDAPRSWRAAIIVVGCASLVAVGMVACARGGSRSTADTPPSSPGDPTTDATASPAGIQAPEAPQAPLPAPKPLPALDHEPLIGVLLQSGDSVGFTLVVPASCAGRDLAAGFHRAAVNGGMITIDGAALGVADVDLHCAGNPGAHFAAALTPPLGGAPVKLRFAGDPALHIAGQRVELIERVGMETYHAGVVPTEMRRDWPAAALQAQAIAARSYACSHWLERADQAWQLHWHYTVDMAYGGIVDKAPVAAAAVAATRGRILRYQGLPLPALFCASSGGTTESCADFLPALRAADGRTPVAPAMPAVADPDNAAGCADLGMTATHGRWHARVALADITAGLTAWAEAHPSARLTMGTVIEITAGKTESDSGRLATIIVRHRRDGREFLTEMPANDFRMAVGPGKIRSTWWTASSVEDGFLSVDGKGFGHGVGLSQVSAYAMAKNGADAATILARFYPGDELVTAY